MNQSRKGRYVVTELRGYMGNRQADVSAKTVLWRDHPAAGLETPGEGFATGCSEEQYAHFGIDWLKVGLVAWTRISINT